VTGPFKHTLCDIRHRLYKTDFTQVQFGHARPHDLGEMYHSFAFMASFTKHIDFSLATTGAD